MEQLLTPQVLASTLGIATQTIYNRYATKGNLPPAIKLGRLLRFRTSDVEAWIESQKVQVLEEQVEKTFVAVVKRRPGRPTKVEQMAMRQQS